MGIGLDLQDSLRGHVHTGVTPFRVPTKAEIEALYGFNTGIEMNYNLCKEIQLDELTNKLTEEVLNMTKAKRYTFEFLYDDGSTYKVAGVNWYDLNGSDSRGNPAISYRKMFGDREELVNVLKSNLAALKIRTKDEIALMRFKPCASIFGEIEKAL